MSSTARAVPFRDVSPEDETGILAREESSGNDRVLPLPGIRVIVPESDGRMKT
jgi:hypothetical protein